MVYDVLKVCVLCRSAVCECISWSELLCEVCDKGCERDLNQQCLLVVSW